MEMRSEFRNFDEDVENTCITSSIHKVFFVLNLIKQYYSQIHTQDSGEVWYT